MQATVFDGRPQQQRALTCAAAVAAVLDAPAAVPVLAAAVHAVPEAPAAVFAVAAAGPVALETPAAVPVVAAAGTASCAHTPR